MKMQGSLFKKQEKEFFPFLLWFLTQSVHYSLFNVAFLWAWGYSQGHGALPHDLAGILNPIFLMSVSKPLPGPEAREQAAKNPFWGGRRGETMRGRTMCQLRFQVPGACSIISFGFHLQNPNLKIKLLRISRWCPESIKPVMEHLSAWRALCTCTAPTCMKLALITPSPQGSCEEYACPLGSVDTCLNKCQLSH